MLRFGRNRQSSEVVEAQTETVKQATTVEFGVVHTPELDRDRVKNLVEVSRIMADAPILASLAMSEAHSISVQRHLPFDEILAGIPDPRPQSQAS